MSAKWLVVLVVSIGLSLVSGQASNVTEPSPATTNATSTTRASTSPPTTVAPTTTTTPAPKTTTPSPTPPQPQSWNGTVSDNDTICLSVRFTGKIDVSYNSTNNTQLSTSFVVPSDAKVDPKSHCSFNESEPQVISINFEDRTSANLKLVFNKTNNEVRVQRVELSFNVTKELFPDFHNASYYGTVQSLAKDDLTLFKVASQHAYVCGAAQTADLADDQAGIKAKVNFADSQVEAYIGKDNQGRLDTAIDCKSSEISDVVPIAVGAALAGLVVIVLIAYFIGRRRSRRLAYQSV